MDFFFVEYRDPIVGLIFLSVLIFLIASAHYIWRLFASKDAEQKLGRFIKKFELASAHKDLLRNEALNFSNLTFLAEIFTKSGAFEKATQIYLIALEKAGSKDEQEQVFLALALVYFKAGFLEKSREVLHNALKIRPRNKTALKLLKIVQLKLKLFKENLELLDCLFELGEEVESEREFIKALMIERSKSTAEEKRAALLGLNFKDNAPLKRLFFEKYGLFKEQDFEGICDLLYKNPKPVNEKDAKYYEFFYALNLVEARQDFRFKNSNLKMFKILKDNAFKARLDFSYLCLECKNIMPLFFYHCPVCYEFNACKILLEVKNDEEC